MKYVLLLQNAQEDRDRWSTMSPEEAQAARADEIPRWTSLMEEYGHILRGGEELDDPETAKTIRVRGGERIVTDGPYAETKEQVGGYFLIDVADLDEAIAFAAKVPVADRASVEIRPLAGE
jgi:hypothetical protein